MSAVTLKYRIEVWWAAARAGRTLVQDDSMLFLRGYLTAVSDRGGPRLQHRLVRAADGKVMGEVAAPDSVAVGLVAGSPTAEQLEEAAQRVLERARAVRRAGKREGGTE